MKVKIFTAEQRLGAAARGRRRKANNPIKEIKKVVRIVKLGSTTINIRQVGCSFIKHLIAVWTVGGRSSDWTVSTI